jgi:pimeloyl-ACP methyl ester carboxylesterase
VDLPQTRYAQSGDVSIAYQVVGEGPFDVVWVPGSVSNVELGWETAALGDIYRTVASFCRLVIFDKRGTGLSDRVAGVADLETRMDDVRAVMDAAGSQRAALVGVSEGGPMSILFAATYPERTHALALYGTLPRFTRAPDYPFGPTRDDMLREEEREAQHWGTLELAREYVGPDASDEEVETLARRMRQSASPGAVRQLALMNAEIDVRDVLRTIRVPTLVLHRSGDHIPIEGARWMARQIPGARFVELGEGTHMLFAGDWRRATDELERFLVPLCTGGPAEPEPDTVLATVLFTDIVGSTAKAAELGDRGWRELLARHHTQVRRELARFRGVELDTAGDGFFARFDGPARAIRCATEIARSVHEIGLDVRAGLHTGECELLDDKVAGIAVSIGARVASQAGAGEVLVSQTVKDLVAGSGIAFEDRGVAPLKGVPGEWRLYAVADASA